MSAQLSVITDVGLAKALNAGVSGFKVNISNFKIGSASGFTPSAADTNIHSLVYTGQAAQLTFRIDSPNRVIYRILLDASVGDFQVGNIGLYLDTNELFALCVLPDSTPKISTQAPGIAGNIKVFDILVTFANLNSLVEFSISESIPATVPQVSVEANLPSAASAPFDLYIVRANSLFNGSPTFAYTDGTQWRYTPVQSVNFRFYTENFSSGVLPTIATGALNSLAIGNGAKITGSGQRTIALGLATAEGNDNLIGVIGTTNSLQKSTGNSLVVLGYFNQGGTSLADQFNLVIGGSNNIVAGIYSSIVGGFSHTITGNYASIIGGKYGNANILGQNAMSVGRFSTNGDAQVSRFVQRALTTTSLATEMFIDGTDRMVLGNFETWAFNIHLVARRSDAIDESAYFKFEGAIDRQGSAATTRVVNTVVDDSVAYDRSQWSATVLADDVNGALIIRVSGELGHIIRWVAFVEVVQVRSS